jgi:uncharacterized protein (DUF849 family)
VLVKACLNGSREQGEHPALPLTAPELAADARRVVEAGAGAVHVHPRGPDGSQSLDPGPCGDAIRAIREAVPGLPVGLTTAAWIDPHPHRLALIERWDPVPDFASVNVSEEGTSELWELLGDLGIGIEAGVTTSDEARRLLDLSVAGRCLRILVEIDREEDEGGAAVAEAARIDGVLDQGAVEAPRLYHAMGRATWAVIRSAAERGRDVRIGLEDTLVLSDGRPARDNAELVAAAVAVGGARS